MTTLYEQHGDECPQYVTYNLQQDVQIINNNNTAEAIASTCIASIMGILLDKAKHVRV